VQSRLPVQAGDDEISRPYFTAAELIAIGLIVAVAAAMVVPYLLSRIGGTIGALPTLLASLASAVLAIARFRRRTKVTASEVATCMCIFAGTAGWILWRSWPDLLPLGGEPDITHHLQLIGFIEQHRSLPRDASAFTQISNMMNYTPGMHLLAALAGVWTGTDGLHTIQTIVAFSVALKAVFVFLIARRILPKDLPDIAIGAAGVLLLFLPYDFFVGSFAHFSFLAQVVSETFAVAMWWALVRWDERPNRELAVMFAIAGVAAFLTWPIWIGPPILVLLIVMLAHRELVAVERVRHIALAIGPIAAIAILHAINRIQAVEIVTTGGAVFRPTAARLGWTFIVLSITGLWLALRERRYRVTVMLLGAIVAQAVALLVLFVATTTSETESPYLALKMTHLALYPLAACGALALGAIWRVLTVRWRASGNGEPAKEHLARRVAWVLTLVLAADVAHELSIMHPRPPAITENLFLAGTWARTHVQPSCVEYLVPQDATSYWLHLAVLWNPSVRPAGLPPPALFFRDAVTRWITNTSYPVAIVDLRAIPRDVREELEVLARFGPIVVAKRPNASTACP
jgi:hypothetical protein